MEEEGQPESIDLIGDGWVEERQQAAHFIQTVDLCDSGDIRDRWECRGRVHQNMKASHATCEHSVASSWK